MSAFLEAQVHPAVVRRLIRGDRAAQEAVYRAYADAVYTLARRVLRDEGLAEEATQDTFVHMIEKAAKLRDVAAIGAWIRSIAVNHCLMRLRSPWQRRREPLPPDEQAVPDGVGATLDLDRALGRLPGQTRLVVWMHCVEGYTHQEIGKAFGRSASFSKSQLARALRALATDQQRNAETPARGRRQSAGGRHERTAFASAS